MRNFGNALQTCFGFIDRRARTEVFCSITHDEVRGMNLGCKALPRLVPLPNTIEDRQQTRMRTGQSSTLCGDNTKVRCELPWIVVGRGGIIEVVAASLKLFMEYPAIHVAWDGW